MKGVHIIISVHDRLELGTVCVRHIDSYQNKYSDAKWIGWTTYVRVQGHQSDR